MVRKIFIYWRDIPSQVVVQRGRLREKVMLGERFQKAIDRAAMRAGKGGSEAYLAEWRRHYENCSDNAGENRGRADDLHAIALAEARRLEESFSQERLEALIRGRGLALDAADG